VRLWMVAEQTLHEHLLRAGELWVDPALMSWRDEPDFVAAYDWMREQMREQMREPIAGYSDGYPWWAWARRASVARPPDLRERSSFHTWPRGTPLVRLELEVPDAEALLSDFAAWGCILNRSIVADDEAEFDRWQALAAVDEGAGCAAARATWPRIFDLQRVAADPAWNGPAQLRTCRPASRRCGRAMCAG